MNDFVALFKKALPREYDLTEYDTHTVAVLKVRVIRDGYELYYGHDGVYAPPLNFSHLKRLSELFVTEDINVNDNNVAGCNTCDLGWASGNDIQLRQVTQHAEQLAVMAKFGKDLYKKPETLEQVLSAGAAG